MSLTASLLAGCGAFASSALEASPAVASPTRMVATLSQVRSATPAPTASTTPRPRPTPTETSPPKAELVLIVEPCLQTFCPPYVLEQQAAGAVGQPGILAAMALDEIHVRLVYDPALLTQEEAIRVFETTTGLEVVVP